MVDKLRDAVRGREAHLNDAVEESIQDGGYGQGVQAVGVHPGVARTIVSVGYAAREKRGYQPSRIRGR